MKIEGYFDPDFKPPAPFVDAIIISEETGIRHKVSFLIDTGASMTILLDKDVKDIGLDVGRLKKPEKQVGGIGGSVKTYLVEDARVVFESDEGFYEQRLLLYVGLHDLTGADEETIKRILVIPSLLGREILSKFDLYCFPGKAKLYLEYSK